MNITIRPAGPADGKAVANMIQQLQLHLGYEIDAFDEAQFLIDAFEEPQFSLFVAVGEDEAYLQSRSEYTLFPLKLDYFPYLKENIDHIVSVLFRSVCTT